MQRAGCRPTGCLHVYPSHRLAPRFIKTKTFSPHTIPADQVPEPEKGAGGWKGYTALLEGVLTCSPMIMANTFFTPDSKQVGSGLWGGFVLPH